MFGLFNINETEFTEETAILTSESNEEGIFTFENVPYGEYIVCELKPAKGYLPNEENYQVTISNNEEIIEITVENDKIPELKTTATIDGKKKVGATEVFTLEDVVEYKHLVPGKEYTVKGILMDKATGKPFLVDGKEITSEVTFTAETADSEVTVFFTFDGSVITKETEIVVFLKLSTVMKRKSPYTLTLMTRIRQQQFIHSLNPKNRRQATIQILAFILA